MDDTLLALDCGTQSLRAMLFAADGTLLHKVKIEYEPYQRSRPGWAEQDAELWWRSLCQAIRMLRAQAGAAFARIRGVGLTTQRATLVFVDGAGNPLRPALTWLDTRRARADYRPGWIRRMVLRAAGALEAVQTAQKEGKANWVRQNQPEIWAATHKILQVSGFLNHRLTGRFQDSVANQVGHIPFNYKKMRWCMAGELPALLFPMEPAKLPGLVPAGALLGGISAAASAATGLPEGLPVIACASDKGTETIGVGCVGESMASLSLGTTATVQTTSARYFEPIAFMPPYPAAMAGHYNPEVEIFRGYWMISWFKRELAPQDVKEALDQGVPPEVLLDRYLRAVPAGSMGLLTLPHWGPSLQHPGTKGAMVGFGDVHTRGHLYRSVLEGLAFGLREGLERIEKAGKRRITRIGLSGGATQSREICQLTADIFGRELSAGETFETAGLGTAVITAVGVGLYRTIPEAAAAMVRVGRIYAPRPRQAALYDKLYRRVYRELHGRLQPLYREIRSIVNYPERASDEPADD
ncbi:MAG: FGGY-family carbohydrate kinase [Holophaga sp.]|nr:FGGY-family carbohydrate kinase [Holophaga sp.]